MKKLSLTTKLITKIQKSVVVPTITFYTVIRLPGDLRFEDQLEFGEKGHEFGSEGNLGKIISSLLPYLFIFGGMILLGMLVYGGFEMMTSLGNEEKFKGGAERIKNALIGFLMLFGVYWLAQLAQVLFKIPIL